MSANSDSKKDIIIKTSLKLDRKLYAEIKRLATVRGVSTASLINEAIKRFIEWEERNTEREK